jgi:hypothetical protein
MQGFADHSAAKNQKVLFLIFNKIQPISVGIWRLLATNTHVNRSEVHFNSVLSKSQDFKFFKIEL